MQASTSVADAAGGRHRASPGKRRAAVAGGTAGLKRAHYRDSRLPLLLLLPQLLVLLLFFFIPAIRALSRRSSSPTRSATPSSSSGSTISAPCSRAPSTARRSGSRSGSPWRRTRSRSSSPLVLAFATDRVIRGRGLYRSVILLPYAIAPVIAGILWAFLFNPWSGRSPSC